MTSLLSQAMDRIAAMEKQALADLTPSVPADAVPYFPYEQEAFPYFFNRLSGVEPKNSLSDQDEDSGEDIVVEYYNITIRLVIGHLGEGYRGERAKDLYEYIPAVLQFFREHSFLTSTAYPSELDYINPLDISIPNGTGLLVFQNAGIVNFQVGTEFTLRLPIIVQVY
jgi:hypothetical protein